MINNRMISSASVIAKVIADLDLKEDQIRITDIREWILEAVLKIGAIQQYEHKVVVLPIRCHQVQLPCDLYKLQQVAYSCNCNGGWLPMRKATSSFGVTHDIKGCNSCGKCGDCNGCGNCSNKCNNNCGDCGCNNMFIHDIAMLPIVKNVFNLVNDRDALTKINNNRNIRSTLGALINANTEPTINGRYIGSRGHKDSTMFSNDLQYMTKPGYIMTNVANGFVKISYYSIYTDEDSMPLIPDLESYKECIYWYVTMKLMYPRRLRGEIDTRTYYDIQNSYNFYRKQAYGEAMMPTVDDMESIKNDWNKLYTEMDDHDTFFSTTGEEQIIYNQNWS